MHLDDVLFDEPSFALLAVGCLEVVLGGLEGKPASHASLDNVSICTLLLGHETVRQLAVARRRSMFRCRHLGHLLREVLLHRLELVGLKAVGFQEAFALRPRCQLL